MPCFLPNAWQSFNLIIVPCSSSLTNSPITATGLSPLSLHKSTPGNSSTSNSSPLTSPHELTVQFGKFLSSFLTLAITHKQSIDERSEPLYNSIIRLRNDFETVMTKCSKKTKSPERFLATNYMYLYNNLQQLHLHLNINDSDAQNYNFDSAENVGTKVANDDDNDSSVPLIIRETENHFKTLVEAFTRN